jgi:NADPH-dependent 2,4-dienoyl-CoA reductase/sulfur reductase-like enzyme
MPPLDPEVVVPLTEHLIAKGVQLPLGDGLARIDKGADGRLIVVAESGASLPADLVILAIGVRPETELAKAAGLLIGSRGGIVVDAQMRTSDPQIWAVGDVVEVPDVVTGQDTVLPLAGPANRQGRVAAESIAGRATQFRGIQATAVVGVLGLTVASTSASEKGLRRAGVTSFERVYLHPGITQATTRAPARFISSSCSRCRTDAFSVRRQLAWKAWRSASTSSRPQFSFAEPCTIWPRPSCAMHRSSARRKTPSTLPGC